MWYNDFNRQPFFPFTPPFGQFQPGGAPTPPPPAFGGQQLSGAPSSAPPAFIPPRPGDVLQGPTVYAVDPGAIRPCTFQFVYLWLTNGQQFWAWLVFVGPRSVAGFRWTRFGWRYFGTDLRNIDTFVCY
jgi:hypothetical protein